MAGRLFWSVGAPIWQFFSAPPTVASVCFLAGVAGIGALPAAAQSTEFFVPEANYAVDGYSKTTEEFERFRNGEWEYTNRERWSYNEGQLELRVFDSWTGDAWRTSRREVYSYSRSQPKTMTMTKEDRRINVYARSQEHVFRYDDDGELVSLSMSAFGPNDQIVPVWQFAFATKRDGDQVEKTRQQRRWQGDTWIDTKLFTEIFVDGRIQSGAEQEKGTAGWEDRQRLTYTYTDHSPENCIEKRTLEMFREGAWVTGLEERYECDQSGTVMEVYHFTPWNSSGQMEAIMRERFKYDEAGNRTQTEYQRLIDDVWTPLRRVTATFHPVGTEPSFGSTAGPRGGSTGASSGVAENTGVKETAPVLEPTGSIDAPPVAEEVPVGSTPERYKQAFTRRPLLFVRRGEVWSTGADGALDLKPLGDFKHVFAEFHPSPDREKIAFIPSAPTRIPGGSNLFLLDTASGSEQQVTTVGRPETREHASVIVRFVGWEPSGLGFYYSVGPNTEAEGGHRTTPAPDVEYGTFAYDLASGSHRSVSFRGDFVVALDNQSVLLSEPIGSPQYPGLYVADAHTGEETKRLSLSDRFRLYEGVNAAGSRLTALTWKTGPSRQLAMVDLESGTYTGHGLPDRFQSVDRPSPSPSGSKWAYVGIANPTTHFLLVDGKGIHAGQRFTYAWIDDAAIVISTDEEIRVVEVGTGKIRGRVPLGK